MDSIFAYLTDSPLPFHQPYPTPVGEGADGEVNPEALSALLYQELVEVLLRLIRNVKEYTRIAYRLFLTQHVDIHRTTRQMVRPSHTTHGLIHRLRTIA